MERAFDIQLRGQRQRLCTGPSQTFNWVGGVNFFCQTTPIVVTPFTLRTHKQ